MQMRTWALLALLALAALAAGCSGGSPSGEDTPSSTQDPKAPALAMTVFDAGDHILATSANGRTIHDAPGHEVVVEIVINRALVPAADVKLSVPKDVTVVQGPGPDFQVDPGINDFVIEGDSTVVGLAFDRPTTGSIQLTAGAGHHVAIRFEVA